MAHEFTILRITELLRQSATGGVEKFYRHQITTTGGIVLTVDIDEKDFTPEKVKPILVKRALEADKILAL